MCSINSNKSEDFVFFWKLGQENEEFSNFYPCSFNVEGITYNCVEQYMMAKKALLFGDTDIYSKIIVAADPDEIKAYGRLVKDFVPEVWDKCKREIVCAGNYAKYNQNLDLLVKLVNTGDAILAEASPLDMIWGIGMSKEDPLAKSPKNWNGNNLLGGILEEIREKLRYKVLSLYDVSESKEYFWYETENGNQVLVTESGKRFVCNDTSEYFNSTEQEHAGWQRATLFIDWLGVWDLTAFAADMNATIAFGPFIDRRRKEEYIVTFSSPSEAEKTVYPFIDQKQEALARKNVDAFYASKTQQIKWFPIILKPICLHIYQDGEVLASAIDKYNPDEILACGGEPIHLGDKESIKFMFRRASI